MVEVGNKFTLWIERYDLEAYTDQMGLKHPGYTIDEIVVVEVCEIRKDVPCMWTDKKDYTGWRAISQSGELFQNNWNVFPSDSFSPTYYWDAITIRDGKRVQPVDAIQAYKSSTPHLLVESDVRAIPTGSHVLSCKKHNEFWYDWQHDSCMKCYYESKR